ncbi:MAG: 4Fe-4S dicluster domain-containing protein [Anaerolineales bacterium]|nr:MAG: 4Fe-4S dicluster domain-containing protein [Anaerolineales bacterium]
MSTRKRPLLSRRDFLRGACAGALAATTAGLLAGRAHPALASDSLAGQTWGVLIDLTRCTGCNSCALACKESNNLPGGDVPPGTLDTDTYTFVDTREVITAAGRAETRYVKRQCMHCLNPSCASACPVGAMHNSGEGPVIYRSNRCIGCRYCQIACPFGIPRFEWRDGISPAISKCLLCYDRLQANQVPACAEACPSGALRFGRREDLLVQARAQIASNSGRYIDHIYGEHEVGGTSMLYLSDIPFEQMGFPAGLPQSAPPEETDKFVSALPYVIGGVTVFMTGSVAYTHRRGAESTAERGEPASVSGCDASENQEE